MKQTTAKKTDIVIIGGGASGLSAAIAAKDCNAQCSVTVLERNSRVGKKLIATGNGRCNFSNRFAAVENYHGKNNAFVQRPLERFSPEETLVFFRTLGVEPREEAEGRIYPYSFQASSFLDLLRLGLEQRGVALFTDAQVVSVAKKAHLWSVKTKETEFLTPAVIFAAGGLASPKLGGTKSGYLLAQSLGHHLLPLAPSLVQIRTETTFPKALKGIKIQGTASLKRHDTLLAKEEGEILFTDYGLSGPPILQLSRSLVGENPKELRIALDFCPNFSYEALQDLLTERQRNLGQHTLENYLTGFLQKKVGQLLLKGILEKKLSVAVESLSAQEISLLAHGLKNFTLPVEGAAGWDNAQVTAGGIDTEEIDAATMESKIAKGCYFCGEILDIDGDCGGFNLQWAWSSGRLAGESGAKQVKHD